MRGSNLTCRSQDQLVNTQIISYGSKNLSFFILFPGTIWISEVLIFTFSATVVLTLEDLRYVETGELNGIMYLGDQQPAEAKFYVSVFYSMPK